MTDVGFIMNDDGNKVSRRGLLAAAAVAGLGTLAARTSEAEADAVNDSGGDLAERRREAERLRVDLAREYGKHPLDHHPTNGDEEDLKDPLSSLPNYVGNFSKGLAHNQFGEPDSASYHSLLAALRSGEPDQFEHIILGHMQPSGPFADLNFPPCTDEMPAKAKAVEEKVKERQYRVHSERTVYYDAKSPTGQALLVDPQAGLGFDLEGVDSHELVMPPPPAFRGKEILAEMAESYWMALVRNIPFAQYGADPDHITADAAADLSKFGPLYKGAKDAGGKVTTDTLFRGTAPGEDQGGYVSQFLLRPVPFGAYQLHQKLAFAYAPVNGAPPDFLTKEADWLDAQNGVDNPAKNPDRDPDPTYIFRGRDLANFVHIDELFQAYFLASLTLGTPQNRGGLNAPHDSGNPYDGYHFDPVAKKPQRRSSTQTGFGTLGEPNIKGMVTEVGTRALKAAWYQKWFVHRRLRPEEFAGRVHFQKGGKRDYKLDLKPLDPVLGKISTNNTKANGGENTWLLPMAFPEGCPLHPSYGAGHATVAGACVTVLKALFHEEITFFDLNACVYEPSVDGKAKPKAITPADGAHYKDVAGRLTVGGELNKLASNVSLGRNFAGVHWRSDHAESLKLGEKVAMNFLRETVQTYNERVSFRVTRFDGTQVVFANSR